MIIGCLKGKVGRDVWETEDVLTSNVFSFFKYAERKTFLRKLLMLNKLLTKDEIELLSDEDLENAEFIFWPSFYSVAFNDVQIDKKFESLINVEKIHTKSTEKPVRTEPDLILIVGNKYILFEAKLNSDFHRETEEKESQLIREFKGGEKEARRKDLDFKLVTVTKHYHYNPDVIYEKADAKDYIDKIKWINWQGITKILDDCLKNDNLRKEDRVFAKDISELLYRYNLKYFYGWDFIKDILSEYDGNSYIFWPEMDKKPVPEKIEKALKTVSSGRGVIAEEQGKNFSELECEGSILKDFWIPVRDTVSAVTELSIKGEPRGNKELNFKAEIPSLYFKCKVFEGGGWGVELVIDRGNKNVILTKELFDFIQINKQEIEEMFGTELDWDRKEESRACSIGYTTKGKPRNSDMGSYKMQEIWPKMQQEIIDAILRLERALMPRIRAFEPI